MGVFAPAKTPRPVVGRIAGAIRAALETAEIRDQLTNNLGSSTTLKTDPDVFEAFVKSEIVRYADLARRLRIAVD